jgi:uncharacterized phiE125 gp8 family phage protein
MPLTLQRTVAPVSEPVTLSEIKSHLRIDITDDDTLLGALLSAARDDVELYLRRQVMPATWRLYLDTWQPCLRLPRPPVSSVTHIKYFDQDDIQQTLATTVYQVDIVSEPARITLKSGQSWPSLKADKLNAIEIQYVAGWADATAVPEVIKHAIKLLVGDLYEHREARLDLAGGLRTIDDNPTLGRLLWKHRVLGGA